MIEVEIKIKIDNKDNLIKMLETVGFWGYKGSLYEKSSY